jgi:hypothetical protein
MNRREATQFVPGRWHVADAAVAILEDYVDLGGGGRMVVSAPTAGTLVVKKGVTTDVTGGVVVSTSFGPSVELAGCPIWFRNQIAVRPAPRERVLGTGRLGSAHPRPRRSDVHIRAAVRGRRRGILHVRQSSHGSECRARIAPADF